MIAWCERKGRETIAAFIVLLGVIISIANLASCQIFTAKNAKTALDAVDIACALANAMLPDARVQQVCGIADDLMPTLQALLSAHRAALAKAERMGACLPADAGVDASPDAAR